MSAPAPAPAPVEGTPAAGTGRQLRDVVVSEWLKIRSVRSTFVTLVVAVVTIVGVSAAICAAYVNRYNSLSPVDLVTFDPAFLSVSGVFLAQLSVGVLGVLTMSSEHATGMIRTSLAAVPQRLRLLGAKALVFVSVSLLVGLLGSFAAFFVGQSILSGRSLETSIGRPGVLRVVVGAALYLAVLGLMALGLGTMIRRTAGAIAAFFGLLLVLPLVVSALPSPWSTDIGRYLPGSAGAALLRTVPTDTLLAPWAGFGLLCAYAAASLVVGAVLLVRRDA